MTPSIRSNVIRWLAHHGVAGVHLEQTPDLPDRVFAFDTQGSLVKLCCARESLFERATGAGHGKSVRACWRERATPSLQVILHEISSRSPSARDVCFLELDFDQHSPLLNPRSLFLHGVEVLVNRTTETTTDQGVIAARLAERGIA